MVKTLKEGANEIALKQQFLDRAKALSQLPEVFRCREVTQLIGDALAFGVRAEAEIFQAVYGDPGGRKYWDAHLSEAIPAYSLAHILSVHLAQTAEQLEMARIAIIRAFRDAAQTSERWFVGETAPLLAVKDGQTNFAGLGKVKVYPRAAIEWLQSKPKREHLVPESLRSFLQPGENTNAEAPARPRPVTEKIAERFVADFIHGEQAVGRLPTLVGLEAAAQNAGMRGGREYLRAAFRRLRGAEFRRGRPPKASTKIAEK